jgi:hypothetical protein
MGLYCVVQDPVELLGSGSPPALVSQGAAGLELCATVPSTFYLVFNTCAYLHKNQSSIEFHCLSQILSSIYHVVYREDG